MRFTYYQVIAICFCSFFTLSMSAWCDRSSRNYRSPGKHSILSAMTSICKRWIRS